MWFDIIQIRFAAQHSVPEDHRDNAPRYRSTEVTYAGAELAGRLRLAAFSSRFLGSRLVPAKRRCLVPPTSPHHPHQGAAQGRSTGVLARRVPAKGTWGRPLVSDDRLYRRSVETVT